MGMDHSQLTVTFSESECLLQEWGKASKAEEMGRKCLGDFSAAESDSMTTSNEAHPQEKGRASFFCVSHPVTKNTVMFYGCDGVWRKLLWEPHKEVHSEGEGGLFPWVLNIREFESKMKPLANIVKWCGSHDGMRFSIRKEKGWQRGFF